MTASREWPGAKLDIELRDPADLEESDAAGNGQGGSVDSGGEHGEGGLRWKCSHLKVSFHRQGLEDDTIISLDADMLFVHTGGPMQVSLIGRNSASVGT